MDDSAEVRPEEGSPTPRMSTTEAAVASGRVTLRDGESLRTRAARGAIITGIFMVAVQMLGMVKGYAVAAFLPASDYGVWGLLVITLGTLLWLGQVGFDDKFIQQDDPDQEKAFQIAFTLQSMLVGCFMALVLVMMPLFSLAYGNWDILLPGYALGLLGLPPIALQTPLWVYYRRMEFGKERLLRSIDPLTGAVSTVALAAAGFGYWSLVIGAVTSSWVAALAVVRASPYRLRFRYEKGKFREYAGFSWPLFVGSINAVLIAQIPILVAQRDLGLAAVGAITLAGTITLYTTRMDEVFTHATYPTICAAKDRVDVLFETFSKSNRMALLWAAPLGVGMALFAAPLVEYVLGDRWRPAIIVIQVLSINAVINQIGFNWGSFFRARGETRPMAVASFVMLIGALGIAVPLLLIDGLRGYAVGMGLATVLFVATRIYYLGRIFPGLQIVRHIARAIAPTIPATSAVLAMRLAGAPTSPGWVLAQLALYFVIVLATTVVSERKLIREFVGYLRGRGTPPVVVSPTAVGA